MEEKTILLNDTLSGIALIKQSMPLIQNISNEIPEAKIVLKDYYKNIHTGERIFEEELKKWGLEKKVSYYYEKPPKKIDTKVELYYFNSLMCNDTGKEFTFPIDPLKFEKRPLLNKKKISDLRKKYLIDKNSKVVLAGSFHDGDTYFLRDVFRELLGNKKIEIILVPRKNPQDIFIRGLFPEDLLDSHRGDDFFKKENLSIIAKKGILDDLYSIADVVLIGDTFHDGWGTDGQNPLEPAFYGKRTIAGNLSSSWNRIAYRGLNESGLLKEIYDPKYVLREILREETQEDLDARKRAKEFIKSMQGAAKHYTQIIKNALYGKAQRNERIYSMLEDKFNI